MARNAWRALYCRTRLRLPQSPELHQRRVRLRLRSRNTQPQSRSAHALASCMSNLSLIGEYAGHTRQADLIRERIDGKAGWW